VRCADDKGIQGGFTLVEILITLAILGILLVLAVGNFGGMNEKYKVEAETKQLYADLMDARARAMQRNRVFFVQINGNDYQTYEDTSPAPGGDGALQNTDTLAVNVKVSHTVVTGNITVPLSFNFNRNGIASVAGFIRVSSTTKPDYDCIWIRATRIKMGQYNASGNTCAEK
jgi:prepilin-type N-terminal cleavage/methylation domain-containing protein